MRILSVGNMYPPHHFGGYELLWRGSVERLREGGHEVRVLTTDFRHGSPDPSIAEDADCHRELRWYWRDHGFPRLGVLARLRIERHNLRVLRRHLAEMKPDIVAWWSMGSMSLALIEHVHREGRPSVAVVMDDWPVYARLVDKWQAPLRKRGRWATLAERLSGIPTLRDLGACTRWVFISDSQRERVEQHLGPLPGARIAHAGVDARLFCPSPEHEWSWRLLYCGRIDARKGIDLGVSALPLLPERATLSVVGDGDPDHRAELEQLAARLGVTDRVDFYRVPRDRLRDEFAEHDALLFTVRWEEPWGVVPLEAMAVGLPVVASGRGGSGEYLADGENCLTADPDGGPEELAAALHRLAGDEALRRRLREGGLAAAARYPDTAFATAVLDAGSAEPVPA